MNKEPIALYIFRFILAFGLFAFMCMLYWSSLLIEEDLKNVNQSLIELRQELDDVKTDMVNKKFIFQEKDLNSTQNKDTAKRPHIDSKYPNLLQPDPFYTKTLSTKLLPVGFSPHGVRQDASIGKPNNLHPFTNWSQVNTWNSMCTLTVARLKFGVYETFAPNMAIKVEARPIDDDGNSEFWIHLRDNVYWAPLNPEHFSEDVTLSPFFLEKHKVTAHDFKFYFDASMNPFVTEAGAVASRNYFGDIDSIEVIDDLTFVVRWKTEKIKQPDGRVKRQVKYVAKQLTGQLRPLARFVYQYFPDGTKIIENESDPDTYLKNSVWAQNFMQHWARNVIVSCGPWLFDGMTEREIRFKRNPNHFFPLDVLVKGLTVTFKNSPDASFQDFKAGYIDQHALQPDQIVELKTFQNSSVYKDQKEANKAIERLDYLSRSYNYVGWNQDTDFFRSRKVRQAMTMAIDRKRIIEQLLNGMGVQITGPFYINSPSYDTQITPWPFDPEMAKRYLEQEGWYDSDGDGIRDKLIEDERVPFRFRLTYYVKNPITKGICEYIATALKEIGVSCGLNGVDMADLSSTFDDKSFDALYLGWGLGTPPEDPKQLWDSKGATEKGSSNAVGFANKEADTIIRQLQFEQDYDKRIELYHAFHQLIHQEQPYTFLFSPKTAFVFREYLKNVFIPKRRQDLIPGANVAEPVSSVFWLKRS